MCAMFLGHSANNIGREEDTGRNDDSEQTALFVCSQISLDMKSLWQELKGLTSAVRHLQSERTEQGNLKKTVRKRSLAKGLPVRF